MCVFGNIYCLFSSLFNVHCFPFIALCLCSCAFVLFWGMRPMKITSVEKFENVGFIIFPHCETGPQPDPTSHKIRVPVFAMIPFHLADEWKRISDAPQNGCSPSLHGWVSTLVQLVIVPRCTVAVVFQVNFLLRTSLFSNPAHISLTQTPPPFLKNKATKRTSC